MYIFFLLIAANLAAQENYVIDSVCIGADRDYRIEGEEGSTYEWIVTDEVGDTISELPGDLFTDETFPGVFTFGSEIQIFWDTPGTYKLSSIQYSIHGCDTTERGFVNVYEPPSAFVGADMTVCAVDTTPLYGAIAENYSRLMWTSSGDGIFDDNTQLSPKYIPGALDNFLGTAMLKLTAWGLADNETCIPAVDSLFIRFSNPEITFAPNHLICYNDSSGSVQALVSKGNEPYTYAWKGDNGFTASVDSIYKLTAGKYVITITDAEGCVVTDSVIITQPDLLLATIDSLQHVICFEGNDGAARVFASGGTPGYTYEWNTLPQQDSSVAMDLYAGDYSVTITDNHLCKASTSVTITEPPPLALSADSVDAKCLGAILGAVDLTVTGGTPFTAEPFYRYEWSDESGIIAFSEDLAGIEGDMLYTVVVTDSVGCTDTLSIFVNEEKDIEITIDRVDSILCYNEANGAIYITASDGLEPYKYLWNTGDTTQNLINIPAGDYWVRAVDANGCDRKESFTLYNPIELTAYITPDTTVEICDNGTILLDGNPQGGTGEHSHLWTGNGAAYLSATTIPDPVFSNAPPGNYTLVYAVTDENACVATDNFTVVVWPVTYSTINDTICETDLPFAWNDSVYFETGTYENILTNVHGCDSIITFNLHVYDEIIIEATVQNAGLHGEETGGITLATSGGTAPYQWLWDTGETTESISGLGPGEYTVMVTDANGCVETLKVKVDAEAPDYEINCPPTLTLSCYENLADNPPYTTYADWAAAGGKAFSERGIDTTTFTVEGGDEIVEGGFCWNIERTYTVLDSLGFKLQCTQMVVVDDKIKPNMIAPPDILDIVGALPLPYTSYSAFQLGGGNASDNCGIIEGSFQYVDDIWDGKSNPSTYTRIYEIADFCGNIGRAEQIIKIYQSSDIVLNCYPPFIYRECKTDVPDPYVDFNEFLAAGGTAVSSPFDIDPSTFEWKGDASDNNSCPEIITRIYSIKNTAGEEATCGQQIIINDVTPPALRFWSRDVACGIADPVIYTTIAMLRNSSRVRTLDDNCGLKEIKLTKQDRTGNKCQETLTRTYELTDSCGNKTIATEITNFIDRAAPVVIRPVPDIVSDECEIPKPYANYAEYNLPGGGEVVDLCTNIVLLSFVKDSVGGEGIIYRTYRFTDPCGNFSFDVQKITIKGIITPEFMPLGPICQFGPAPLLGTVSTNGITGSWSPDTIQTTNVGLATYTFTPDDGQCAAPVTMNIEVTPAIELTAEKTDLGYSIEPIGSIDLKVEGGTGPFKYIWSNEKTTQDISELPAGEYTVLVKDIIGCEAILTVTIESADLETAIICPDTIHVECHSALLVNPPYTYYKEFSDAGGSAKSNVGIDTSAFAFIAPEEIIDIGHCLSLLRTYSVADSLGNSVLCQQVVNVIDTTPPLMVCPDDETAECLTDLPFDIKTIDQFIEAGGLVSDNCAIDSASFAFIKTETKYDKSIEINTVYTIADLCGNSSSCTHNIVLTDTIPPVPNCTEITVYLNGFGVYLLTQDDIDNISAGATDNCTSPENLVIEVDFVEFNCEDVESGVLVNVLVTDEAGNSDSCLANILVLDTIPPEALCRPVTIYLDTNGQAGVTTAQIDNGSADNCELDTMYLSKYDFTCLEVGDNKVVLTVVDTYNNMDSCTAIVTVLDTIAPVVNCVAPFEVQLDLFAQYKLTVEEILADSYDECGIDTVYLDIYDLDCDHIGITTITVTAVDVNGNHSSCSTDVTVYGNIAPVVQNDSARTVQNTSIAIDVAENDYDVKGTIDLSSLKIKLQPQNGTIETGMAGNISNGIFTYTPALDFVGIDTLTYTICDDAIPCEAMCGTALVYIKVLDLNNPPTAVDDEYVASVCDPLTQNLIENDFDVDGDQIRANSIPVKLPIHGVVTIGENGFFTYTPDVGFTGIDSFMYEICDNGLPTMCDTATVYITLWPDNDCDGVPDHIDVDDDNDGIPDSLEGDGMVDSDTDGVPDSMDIDSDNDGIPDIFEGQVENDFFAPLGIDANNNGWDAAYDPEEGGYPFFPVDTDGNGVPDYLDSDSDGDGVPDFIEGHDLNADGMPDVTRIFIDSDNDGLDDAYDIVYGCCDPYAFNPGGSNAPLQDFDGDGTRDWRDVDDDADGILTFDEDLNNDGDWSNDDTDLDGFPEYLDISLDCELFIPEGFSPNDDGVHDFFQILCIQRYPNARLMIFNRNGNKLFDKEHYGNLDVWGSDQDAWWWGYSDHNLTIGRAGGLPAGNYVYVIELGNGEVKNGTVMISY